MLVSTQWFDMSTYWKYCKMTTTVSLVNILHHAQLRNFLLVIRTFKPYSQQLSSLQHSVMVNSHPQAGHHSPMTFLENVLVHTEPTLSLSAVSTGPRTQRQTDSMPWGASSLARQTMMVSRKSKWLCIFMVTQPRMCYKPSSPFLHHTHSVNPLMVSILLQNISGSFLTAAQLFFPPWSAATPTQKPTNFPAPTPPRLIAVSPAPAVSILNFSSMKEWLDGWLDRWMAEIPWLGIWSHPRYGHCLPVQAFLSPAPPTQATHWPDWVIHTPQHFLRAFPQAELFSLQAKDKLPFKVLIKHHPLQKVFL